MHYYEFIIKLNGKTKMQTIISARQTRIRRQRRNARILDIAATAGMFLIVGVIAVYVVQDYIETRHMLEAAKAAAGAR